MISAVRFCVGMSAFRNIFGSAFLRVRDTVAASSAPNRLSPLPDLCCPEKGGLLLPCRRGMARSESDAARQRRMSRVHAMKTTALLFTLSIPSVSAWPQPALLKLHGPNLRKRSGE